MIDLDGKSLRDATGEMMAALQALDERTTAMADQAAVFLDQTTAMIVEKNAAEHPPESVQAIGSVIVVSLSEVWAYLSVAESMVKTGIRVLFEVQESLDGRSAV